MNTLEQGVFRTEVKREKNVEFLMKEKKIIWDGKLARLEMITENGEKE